MRSGQLVYPWGCHWHGLDCLSVLQVRKVWPGCHVAQWSQQAPPPVQLSDPYKSFIKNSPAVSIKDLFNQNDWETWQKFTARTGIQVVGNDPSVTSLKQISKAVVEKSCNYLLLKVYQISSEPSLFGCASWPSPIGGVSWYLITLGKLKASSLPTSWQRPALDRWRLMCLAYSSASSSTTRSS